MEQTTPAHLFVISDARALAWILSQGRLAFGDRLRHSAKGFKPGHRILLYTTQRCFGGSNHNTQRPFVIGEGVLTSDVETLKEPYKLDERVFPLGCTMDLVSLAPRAEAPDFAKLVPRLHGFKGAWHLRLRGTLVPLDEHDYRLISNELARTAMEPTRILAEYVLETLANIRVAP
jgi:hypothetical protein